MFPHYKITTGYEGMMRIKEGDKSNTFLSGFLLQIKVNDGNISLNMEIIFIWNYKKIR